MYLGIFIFNLPNFVFAQYSIDGQAHLPHEEVIPETTRTTATLVFLPQSHSHATLLAEPLWISIGVSILSFPNFAFAQYSIDLKLHLPHDVMLPDVTRIIGASFLFPQSQTHETIFDDPLLILIGTSILSLLNWAFAQYSDDNSLHLPHDVILPVEIQKTALEIFLPQSQTHETGLVEEPALISIGISMQSFPNFAFAQCSLLRRLPVYMMNITIWQPIHPELW